MQPATLSYHHQKFMQLGSLIAEMAATPEVCAGFPELREKDGRYYWFSDWGHNPLQTGCHCLFAYDEGNDVFLQWHQEMDDYNYDLSILENSEIIEGQEFSSLEDLKADMR